MAETGFMGLIFAIIIIVGVTIPISTSVVTAANLTGMNATLATYIPTFLLIAVLGIVARSTGMV